MPHTASAKKNLRKSEKRRQFNKSRMSRLRTEIKKFHEAVEEKKLDEAEKLLVLTAQLLDKAAKTHLIHANNASRHKSRLAIALQGARDQKK